MTWADRVSIADDDRGAIAQDDSRCGQGAEGAWDAVVHAARVQAAVVMVSLALPEIQWVQVLGVWVRLGAAVQFFQPSDGGGRSVK